MSSQQPQDNPDPSLKIWSCIICRRRKIRCDRRDPCANCLKSNIDCHYPVTGRVPRRSRDPTAWKSPSQKQSELLSRLRRLETVVTELAAQVEDGSHNPSHTSSTSGAASTDEQSSISTAVSRDESGSSKPPTVDTEPGSEFDEEFGRLVIDKEGSLHVGNRFWSVFCSEVDNILEAVHDVAEMDESRNTAIQEPSDESEAAPSFHQSFIFGHGGPEGQLSPSTPSSSQISFIWQTYVERIDPFIKILHIPSTETIITNITSQSTPPSQALISAITFAALTSLDQDETSATFHTSRTTLLANLGFQTEQALARADFMTTKDMTTVQALVIYLSILPHIGGDHLIWPLTGLLLRIAKSLGLHQEPKRQEMDQVAAELRRRLWWQICFIDSSSQRSGLNDLSMSPASFNTKPPQNISDADLNGQKPKNSEPKATEVTLCLIRCEIWKLVQTLRTSSATTFQARLHAFHQVKTKIEKTHLNHLDPKSPLENFIKTMTSLFFAKVQLIIYRRRGQHHNASHPDTEHSTQQDTALSTFGPSLDIIEAVHALQTEPTWKKWRWQLQGQVPWHALGIFLQQACHRSWDPVLERGWIQAIQLTEAIPEGQRTGPLWQHLKVMLGASQARREATSARLASRSPVSPDSPHLNPALALGNRSETPISYITINPHSGATGSGSLTPDWTPVPKSSPGTSNLAHEVNFSQEWSNAYQAPTSLDAPSSIQPAENGPENAVGEVNYSAGFGEPGAMDWQEWDQLVEMDYAWDFIAL